mmetsp:Transcript_31426/g.56944  ORF Transcript_31426/g.56944 Transcript_31426/m.56944 type:complete len:254 (+) Transcript_31426:108-869(+)
MAPNIDASSPDAGSSNDVISRIYLIRHGDRFDYANPSWLESAKENGALITDPPLSALGHRQARETADQLGRITKTNDGESSASDNLHHVDKILVSPYLRVIQTACPTSNALGMPLSIENGLSEAHATPGDGVLPSPKERFAYFPQIDPNHTSLLNVQPTPGHICPKTGFPCEAFAGKYCQRMERFATILERTYHGKTIVYSPFSASVALVAALLKCSMRAPKFAPCGIGLWTLVRNGNRNDEYVKENSSTTHP